MRLDCKRIQSILMDAAVDKIQKRVPNFVASIFNILINRHVLVADYTQMFIFDPFFNWQITEVPKSMCSQKCVFQLVEKYDKAIMPYSNRHLFAYLRQIASIFWRAFFF